MTTYYTFANRFVAGTKAKAAGVDAQFDAIQTGFALVTTDMDAVIASIVAKADTSALAAYALLAGAAFSGSISTSDNLNVGASIGAGGNISANAAVFAEQTTLTFANQFYMGTNGPTIPIINFDSGDFLQFERAANQFDFVIGGVAVASLTAGLLSLAGAAIHSNDITSSRGDGTGVIFLGDGSHYLYWNGGQFVLQGGALNATGLLYGRGGGAGLGRIFVQPVGDALPGGLADGDVVFQF